MIEDICKNLWHTAHMYILSLNTRVNFDKIKNKKSWLPG